MQTIAKHILEVRAKLINARLFRIAFDKIVVVVDVPPVTLAGTET